MRHKKRRYTLGHGPAHRKALFKNLCISMIFKGRITTTLAKGKALRPILEKLITLAKNDTLSQRRLAYKKLNNKYAVNVLFEKHGPEYRERPGGYTRIVKFSERRLGDNAKMCIISFV